MLYKKFKFLIFLLLGVSTLYSAPIRIMPFGDSLTYDNLHEDAITYRPSSQRTAYRNHLWYMLEDANYDANFVGSLTAGEAIEPSFDPNNEGHSGWNSYELSEKTYEFMTISKPDIVLLHIGTNDHDSDIRGVNIILDQIDLYEKEFKKDVKVLVALILDREWPDYFIRAFNLNLEDLLYRRMHQGDNLVLVDMYGDANLNGSDYEENTHPNSEGYRKMAKVWFDALTTPYTPKLHAYPYSIVNKDNIQSVSVNEDSQTVTFTSNIPDSGIIF